MKNFMFLLLSVLLLTASVNAQSIIWIETNDEDTGTEPSPEMRDMLTAEGYEVQVLDGNSYSVPLRQGQIDTLNDADLVMISRANYSQHFQDSTAWNGIKTPIILMSAWMARESRLKWVENSNRYESNEPDFHIEKPSHPIFDGVNIDGLGNAIVFDTSVSTGLTMMNDITNAGNGELLATNKVIGKPTIIYWKEGTVYNSNTNQVAGAARMLFPIGFQVDSLSLDMPKPTTAEGDKLFKNAVAFMVAQKVQPKSIIWIETNDEDTGTEPSPEMRDMLTAEGYEVQVLDGNSYSVPLRQGQIDTLNDADLVMISRANYSQHFQDSTAWNGIKTPIILMSAWMARESRLKWVENSNRYESNEPDFHIEKPSHPIFDGVNIDGLGNAIVFDTSVSTGLTMMNDITNAGNGELLATNKVIGKPTIIYWKEGTVYNSNTNQVAGAARMLFPIGFQVDSLSLDMPKPTTADGDKLFKNAVAFMIEGNSGPTDLILHYDYNNVSGTTIPDVTDNGFDGTLINDAQTVDGVSGEAIHLENEAITVPDDIVFNQSTLTIASWVKVTKDLSDEWYAVMIHDQGGINEYGLLVMDNMGIAFHAPGLGLEEITDWNSDALVKNEWSHMAVTVDTDGKAVLYLNGVEITSATGGHEAGDIGALCKTFVGGSENGSKNFPGVDLDDTRFYDHALSADEIAELAAKKYTLNIGIVGNGGVSKSPAEDEFEEGTDVELTAIPYEGYEFASWSGNISSTDNPITVTMDSNISVTATFELIKFQLTTTIEGEGTVSPANGWYVGGTFITATAADGWKFDSWSGDITGSDNPAYIDITGTTNITATFVKASSIDETTAKVSLSNYPNPVTNVTTINYSINEASAVSLIVYNTSGKAVKVIVNETKQQGEYSVKFDAGNLPSGVYIYKLQFGSRSIVNKMILK